jgi:hypothetical protein
VCVMLSKNKLIIVQLVGFSGVEER